jgi:hypothetical protein
LPRKPCHSRVCHAGASPPFRECECEKLPPRKFTLGTSVIAGGLPWQRDSLKSRAGDGCVHPSPSIYQIQQVLRSLFRNGFGLSLSSGKLFFSLVRGGLFLLAFYGQARELPVMSVSGHIFLRDSLRRWSSHETSSFRCVPPRPDGRGHATARGTHESPLVELIH